MDFKLTPNIAAVLLLVIIVFITGEPELFLYGIAGYLLGYLFSQYEEDCD